MKRREGLARLPRPIWTLVLIATVGAFTFTTMAAYRGTFRSYVPVTLMSDRSGLVMEVDAKVKLRGVDIGRVGEIVHRGGRAALKLEIDPGQIRYIPANVGARIAVTTAFGAKYVDLVPPADPTPRRLGANAVLTSSNVTTEVNTVFENIVDLLKLVDPAKLNAVLTAVAEGMRGQGSRIGQAATDFNQVLLALNARNDVVRADLRAVEKFGDTYNTAAKDILTVLDAASTTSDTVVKRRDQLDSLLMSATGLATGGADLLAKSKDNLVAAVNTLEPTTNLLLTYNPEYTCTLQGVKLLLDKAVPAVFNADNATLILDVGVGAGNDPYLYPENLQMNKAKGGPGGKPGCGSLPDPRKNFPVRQLITNTGWGAGLDWRPNPGIGSPCFINYLPAGRGYPQKPFLRMCMPGPAPGPVPYPGAPPFGAPMYGPGGVPLYPGLPHAQPGPPTGPVYGPHGEPLSSGVVSPEPGPPAP